MRKELQLTRENVYQAVTNVNTAMGGGALSMFKGRSEQLELWGFEGEREIQLALFPDALKGYEVALERVRSIYQVWKAEQPEKVFCPHANCLDFFYPHEH